MNPWGLSAADLLVFAIVLHLIADWPGQNDWMATNKARRWPWRMFRDGFHLPTGKWHDQQPRWWERHPAAYVHAAIHALALAPLFGWVSLPLAVVHLLIDTRTPVVWWSKLVRQTQPAPLIFPMRGPFAGVTDDPAKAHGAPFVDVGLEVRFWTDQTFHIACLAIAALLVTL